jgi:D-beta-D-heptose 7-phosphate kinase/D-beta-D-heptose 1-phosphate adenosyltransferase
VTVFGEDTPEKLIHAVKPDVLAKGGDWKERDIVGAGYVRSLGGRVARIAFVKGYSTSGLIERLSA